MQVTGTVVPRRPSGLSRLLRNSESSVRPENVGIETYGIRSDRTTFGNRFDASGKEGAMHKTQRME